MSKFIGLVQADIDEDAGNSIRELGRKLYVNDANTCGSCEVPMRGGQFMPQKTREKRMTGVKCLLNKLKSPKEPEILLFFYEEKYLT